jgi:hypothetical protein
VSGCKGVVTTVDWAKAPDADAVSMLGRAGSSWPRVPPSLPLAPPCPPVFQWGGARRRHRRTARANGIVHISFSFPAYFLVRRCSARAPRRGGRIQLELMPAGRAAPPSQALQE